MTAIASEREASIRIDIADICSERQRLVDRELRLMDELRANRANQAELVSRLNQLDAELDAIKGAAV